MINTLQNPYSLPHRAHGDVMSKPAADAFAWSGGRAGLISALLLVITFALSAMAVPPSKGSVDGLTIAVRTRDAARIVYPADRSPVLALPGGGTQLIRSVLNVNHVLTYGEYVWNDAGVGPGPISIRVDLGRQLVSVFRGGDEIGTALVIFGTDSKPTPSGILKILGKAENHYSHKYNVPMAYTLWLTADGIAIHASDVRAGYATQGCIGVPIGFARRLFGVTRVGDKVGIIPSGRTT